MPGKNIGSYENYLRKIFKIGKNRIGLTPIQIRMIKILREIREKNINLFIAGTDHE